mgnify:CR=1 FL=1
MSSQTQGLCNTEAIRAQFPILQPEHHERPLIYLDNTATTQKPKQVIDRIHQFYQFENATVHRGIYGLSQRATETCDETRRLIQEFINAESASEIVFTKGSTEAINLVASSLSNGFFKEGDEILITEMEHHANIIPWQEACKKTGAKLVVAPINEKGELNLEALQAGLSKKTKLLALTHISNVLGTVNPVQDIIKKAKEVDALVLIDGAQAIAHCPVDVQALNCDFYCFSSHKMYGPTGIGVLYGKYDLLESMPVYQTGGDMIKTVTFEKTTFNAPPLKFEAGTPAIAQIIGLGEAIRFIQSIGFDVIEAHEKRLLEKAELILKTIHGVRLIGEAENKAGIVSFVMQGIHPHDAGSILDDEGIAVRVGHHCAQPLMAIYQVPATIRASFSIYNLESEMDRLKDALEQVKEVLL